MKNIKTKVLKLNPKKGFLKLFWAMIIFIVIAGIGAGAKFGSRIPEMKQSMELNEQEIEASGNQSGDERENNEEYDRDRGRRQDKEHESDWENVISFTTSDYVFLGIVVVVFHILFGVYWLYTAAYVVWKSRKIGVNAWFFGLVTLLTNVFGVALLWLYIGVHHICPECGKLQPRKANNCAECGGAIYIKCPDCGERISIKDQYCNGCGRKMHEK